ncbi:DUF58 domain-containing protein [Devosia sp. D6-9]|nr:DUF58 domain-containing protein [Devosia sp. D6-9]
MTPSPILLQELSRSRLRLGGATAGGGTGERRSRQKGPGMEFADYRPYEAGDDFRYLDAAIYARRGEYHIRQYEVYRPAQITILLDGSTSMHFGEPDKFTFAATLAGLLGFAGLAGGDIVQLAVWSGERVHFSPRVNGAGRASALFEWLERQKISGSGFTHGLKQVLGTVPGGLVIAISDWLDQAIEPHMLSRPHGVDVLAVAVSSRQEEDPEFTGQSELRLRDSETGAEFDFTADKAAVAEYRQVYQQWREDLRGQFLKSGCRFIAQRSDMDIALAVRTDWRRQGILE